MKKNKLKRNIALKLFSTSATATMLFSSLLGPISAMAESVETTTVEEQVQFDETQENQTQSEELEVPVVEEHIHNGEEENILTRGDSNSITAPEVLEINVGEAESELKYAFRKSAKVYHKNHLIGDPGCLYHSYSIQISGVNLNKAGEYDATFRANFDNSNGLEYASTKIKVIVVGPSTPPPSGSGINGGSISNGFEMLEKDGTVYGNLRIYLPSKPVQLTTKDTENISNVDRLLKKTVSFQVDSYPTNDYTLNLTSTNVISGKPGSYYVNYELKYKSYVRTFKMMVDVTKIDNSLEEGQKAVDDLFTDNQHTSLKAGIVQANIDAAKVIVNQVTDASKKEELLNEIQKAQDLLTSQEATEKAETIVNDLFADDDHTTLAEGVTQEVIDAAKEAVNQVTDAGKKEELTNEINKAQDALNEKIAEAERQEAASKAVDELFKDNDPTTGIIKDEVTQEAIDAAKELVASVTDPAKKEELTNEINKAQDALNAQTAEEANQLAAENAINGLFKDNSSETNQLKNTVTQDTINAAKELLSKVTDPDKKAELQAKIDQAQKLFDASHNVSLKPVINPVGPFQQAITGTVPAGTAMVRLLVNGVAQRTAFPDADGNFTIYSRFVTDGVNKNLRLQGGDIVTVDYGFKGDPLLASSVVVNKNFVKPIVDTVAPLAEYVTGMVPVGSQVIRLLVNGVPQRTATAAEDINANVIGGIDMKTGKFKIYSRIIKDENGVSRKLRAGDQVTIDSGVQIPGATGTTVTVK